MPRRGAFIVVAASLLAASATPAGAVLKGKRAPSLAAYTVRLVGDGTCSGVVIARQLVATARHCAYGMTVVAAHHYYRVAKVSRLGTLDDGRHVKALGDSSLLHLTKPLPETVAAVPVADGDTEALGDSFVIAGFGGGRLRQAHLVAESKRALIDPGRKGAIGASACFGDSGGPVIRGGWLVGVVTRAAHTSPRRACGMLTRWAEISIASDAWVAAMEEIQEAAEKARAQRRARQAHPVRGRQPGTAGWLSWFTPPATQRR